MKHEIIYTEYYALIVSDEEMVEGDYALLKGKDYFEIQKALLSCLKNAFRNAECWNAENRVHNTGHRKIIAHKPLTDAPIFEGVPLLPEFSEEDSIKDYSLDAAKEFALNHFNGLEPKYRKGGYITIKSILDVLKIGVECGHKFGLKQAKETYKYTEEDILDAWELGASEGLPLTREKKDKLIKSLQQPKRPKYFETVCDCQECGANKTNLSLDMGCENKIATITNSQGQTELVGKYTF
jgi:hypothetical protein